MNTIQEKEIEGMLVILTNGRGFIRFATNSYMAGPDDIYVSPSQIRRFNLRTKDTISGKVRPPKDNEQFFILLEIKEINGDSSEAKDKINVK